MCRLMSYTPNIYILGNIYRKKTYLIIKKVISAAVESNFCFLIGFFILSKHTVMEIYYFIFRKKQYGKQIREYL